MNAGNLCRVAVGRLLEIDVRAGYQSVADVDDMIARIKEQSELIPKPTRLVIAADWRACRVMTPDVAERAVAMMMSTNKRVERSAILHQSTQATSVLQVLRVVRESHCAHRRVFTDPSEMEQWLGEVLDDAERERLAALLYKRDASLGELG